MNLVDGILSSFKLFDDTLAELEEEVKAGKFVTIEGRPVFIGGPGGGGGGAAPGIGIAVEIMPISAPALEASGYMAEEEMVRVLAGDFPITESFDVDEIEEMGWDDADEEIHVAIKMEIASQLAHDTGISEEECAKFVHQWAESSNDEDMRSLALQQDVASEFGVPLSDFTGGRIAVMAKGAALPKDRHPQYHSLLDSNDQRRILRAMYDNTQESMAKQGIGSNDTVTLFRGIKFGDDRPSWGEGDTISFMGNAIESWSISSDIARGFSDGVIFAARVPVLSILSTARSGFGCLREGEVVVLGSVPGSEVLVWETA